MINLIPNAEHQAMQESVRRFLSSRSDSTAVRKAMQTSDGRNPPLWMALADELGVQALAIEEEYGGVGLNFAEVCIVLGELGRSLAVCPYLASVVLAANAIEDAGDEQAMAAYLPGIASGQTVATLAVLGPEDILPDNVSIAAMHDSGDWTLSGSTPLILDGMAADVLLFVATTQAGPRLFAVEADAPGLSRTPLSVMDLTRKCARAELNSTPAKMIGTEGVSYLSRTLDLAVIAACAEQVGGAQRCLEMAVDHAKNRYQFGRAIGSYQAISHKCADMFAQVEMARSALLYAISAAQAAEPRELAIAASLAKSFCSEAYLFVAGENIQVHGGIGFAWEHDAHLYFKRAKSSELILGDPYYHRRRLASLLHL